MNLKICGRLPGVFKNTLREYLRTHLGLYDNVIITIMTDSNGLTQFEFTNSRNKVTLHSLGLVEADRVTDKSTKVVLFRKGRKHKIK